MQVAKLTNVPVLRISGERFAYQEIRYAVAALFLNFELRLRHAEAPLRQICQKCNYSIAC